MSGEKIYYYSYSSSTSETALSEPVLFVLLNEIQSIGLEKYKYLGTITCSTFITFIEFLKIHKISFQTGVFFIFETLFTITYLSLSRS